MQNVGSALLPAQTSTLAYYLSSDTVLDGGEVPLGTRAVTALGAGAASAAATVLTIPANTAPGVYRVLVRADNSAALGEVDEANNVKATGPLSVASPSSRRAFSAADS